jgi:hypothetical protein
MRQHLHWPRKAKFVVFAAAEFTTGDEDIHVFETASEQTGPAIHLRRSAIVQHASSFERRLGC